MAHPTRSLTHGSFHDVINFINLNQDFTCISVGTKNGYNLFNCEPFGKCFAKGMYLGVFAGIEIDIDSIDAGFDTDADSIGKNLY